ncbi:hypothetical protein KIM372_03080 [Bombiscardovia nodaiensis]|uniref:SAF domain-containing protein n=1 Tax=Bombiscardovia nodaiensis TaxID=2932181 RepID=A0ABM8B6D1_9BIFI|nr:hypothetical protein KIM372_03080 [Bombiscardovia nodaiensis]
MVKLVSLPASALSAHLLTSKGQATGKIAQIGLTAGQPLLAQAVSPAPLLPTGATSVRLALASAPESLLPGQKVELIASTDCSHPLPPAPGSQQPPTSGQCLVAQQALTMQLPATADEQASGSKNAAGSTASGFTTFALQAEDALRALGLPENAAIIAVYQAPTANPQPSQQAARP